MEFYIESDIYEELAETLSKQASEVFSKNTLSPDKVTIAGNIQSCMNLY